MKHSEDHTNTISHRSSILDRTAQEEKLRQILEPVKAAWQNPEFTKSLSSFPSFCEMIGFGRLPDFLMAHNFHKVADWSAQSLDSDGQAMQAGILARSQVCISLLSENTSLTRFSYYLLGSRSRCLKLQRQRFRMRPWPWRLHASYGRILYQQFSPTCCN